MKVMLAKTYNPSIIRPPFWMQPKIDGVRAYFKYSPKANEHQLVSRYGKIFEPSLLPHLYEQLSRFPHDMILDGELYCEGWIRHRINGAVNRDKPNADTPNIQYYIFDCYLHGNKQASVKRRWEELEKHKILQSAFVKFVYMRYVETLEQGDFLYGMYLRSGYEGAMYRVGANTYEQGVRSSALLKRKPTECDWFKIVGVKEGEEGIGGKFLGTTGALVLLTEDGLEFSAGSGLSDKQRDELWKTREKPHGYAKVEYECLDTKIPQQPRVKDYDLNAKANPDTE